MRELWVGVLALVATSATALDGTVTAPDGSPLAGIRVAVAGRAGGAVSDDEGRFRLLPDPPPPFELVLSRGDGAILATHPVATLPPREGLRIVVEASAAERVTVVAGLLPGPELPPANAAFVIGASELAQRAPASLTEAIADVPAAARIEEGASGVPTLRGLGRSRTLILLDDGRVTAERRAGPSATFLDPETLEGIEVLRGPGAIAYGSEAFGGVIRARTRLAAVGERAQVRFALLGASGTRERGAAAEVTAPMGRGALLVGAQGREADDYESPRGTIDASAARFAGLRLAWQQAAGRGVLRLGVRSDFGREIGKPAADSRVTRASYPEEDSHRLSWEYEATGLGGWTSVSVSGLLDSYRLLTDRDRLASAAAPRQLTRADVDARDYGLRLAGERELWGGTALVGLDLSGRFSLHATNETFSYDRGGNRTGSSLEIAIDDARRDDWGAFATVQRRVGGVALAAGLRGDRVATRNTGGAFGSRSSARGALSAFAAGTIALAPFLEATVQVARGFRAPLLSDLYYRGISGRGFITGNPDLDSESSNQLDLALRWHRGSASLAGYAYRYRIEDMIERYRSGNDYFFRNRGEGVISGFELEGGVRLSRSVALSLGGQWLRGEVRDDGAPLDDIPPLGVTASLRGDAGERLWWRIRAAAYARDERPGPTETSTAGYAVFDGGVGWRLSPGLEIALLGRNLGDADYRQTADPNGVAAPGRSFQVTLRGRV